MEQYLNDAFLKNASTYAQNLRLRCGSALQVHRSEPYLHVYQTEGTRMVPTEAGKTRVETLRGYYESSMLKFCCELTVCSKTQEDFARCPLNVMAYTKMKAALDKAVLGARFGRKTRFSGRTYSWGVYSARIGFSPGSQ